MSHADALRRLMTFSQYQAERSQVFPSVDSLRWFERQHRPVLLERGAIVAPTGRKMVDPQAFDAVALEVGRSRAIAESADGGGQ